MFINPKQAYPLLSIYPFTKHTRYLRSSKKKKIYIYIGNFPPDQQLPEMNISCITSDPLVERIW